jgi:hypothetical protein
MQISEHARLARVHADYRCFAWYCFLSRCPSSVWRRLLSSSTSSKRLVARRSRSECWGHLAATTFVIACQLPTSDIDDDGYNAISHFLTFFVEHCGA